MTEAEMERFVALLYAKHEWHVDVLGRAELLASAIATTVVDTLLVAEGSLSIDDFEPGGRVANEIDGGP